MPDVNAVILRGNLAADPETKVSRNGHVFAMFRVATQGDRKDSVDYHRVIAWGSLAEQVGQAYQGDRIELSGSLHTRSWEGPDGTKRYITEVRAHTLKVRFRREAAPAPAPAPEPSPPQAPPAPPETNDDLPF